MKANVTTVFINIVSAVLCIIFKNVHVQSFVTAGLQVAHKLLAILYKEYFSDESALRTVFCIQFCLGL